MRLRKKPWVKDQFFQYSTYSIENPGEWKGNWNTLFGNEYPIHIELGTGRGRFITTLAQQNLDINYIALELRGEVLIQAVRRSDELGLKNIRFILGNVDTILEYFSQDEIERIYLNFVDPWPKNRHAKRRLTHRNYLNMYQQIIKTNGEIHLKTDNEILFEFSLNELSQHSGYQLRNISLNLYRDEENLTKHIQTEYEMKFIEEGKPIYRLEANKAL
ncbi:tRNA (guanosine(46)-N7)-methyltransferase TrmB [Tepidibacillus marianensis]|uniref:tRNA (guanosine(46)-N7)-methyltransferase TrmB n=1 Tax=Tepidibacillus marianensis TaxID=3131995 RepID=UPI0030D43FBA